MLFILYLCYIYAKIILCENIKLIIFLFYFLLIDFDFDTVFDTVLTSNPILFNILNIGPEYWELYLYAKIS